MDLSRGANTALLADSLSVAVSGARQGTVDLMAFQVTELGRVRGDHDFVFFNQPSSVEGAVRLVAGDALDLSLAAVPAEVAMVTVAVALDDSVPGTLSAFSSLGVRVQVGGAVIDCPVQGLTTERAVVLLEIYRRKGAWKIRNVSAGWDGGLADLVREHGVVVDESVDDAMLSDRRPAPHAPTTPVQAPYFPASPAVGAPPSAPLATAPLARLRSLPGEQGLSFEKRERLDLRKQEVHKVLLTKGAPDIRARVIMVIDKTGSMHRQYTSQVVHRVVERMVPVAMQLDEDGTLEAYLYGSSFAKLPDLRVEHLDAWSETFLHLSGTHGGINYREIGGANDEIPIMKEVMATLQPGDMPTLVLFFTDGGFTQRRAITKLVRDASCLPAFWQFVGIGRANYGLLTALDELDGRVVDNVGFFELDDIDRVSDAELYSRLLSEFPGWLRAARAAGILP